MAPYYHETVNKTVAVTSKAGSTFASFPYKLLILLVRMRGLEPPLPCENLNLARLPIPPHPHNLAGLLSIFSGAPSEVKLLSAPPSVRQPPRAIPHPA